MQRGRRCTARLPADTQLPAQRRPCMCMQLPPSHLDGAVQRGGGKGVGVLGVEHQLRRGKAGGAGLA